MHFSKNQKKKLLHILPIAIILLIALFFRTWHIDTTPPGLYPEEANNATNAYHALKDGNLKWFYSDNNGREGFYINLMALSFLLFGVSTLTIKLPSILLGVLTVFAIYCLCRELFLSKPRIALIASYLCAVSFWAVNFSRIGFRAIAMLPIICFIFYFLFRGIRTGKIYNYIIAGSLFGLGFHTYIAFRIMPLVLFVLLILFLLIEEDFLKRYWKAICTFTLSAGMIILPLIITFVAHPEYIDSRSSSISILDEDNRRDGLALSLVKSVGLSLAKFNLYGDPNWRHGFPPFPMLEPLTGLAFLSGLAMIIGVFFHNLYLRLKKNVRGRNLVISGLLLTWFAGFLAPEFMTTEGLPHALRSLGVLPVVLIFAAYAIDHFMTNWQIHYKKETTSHTIQITHKLWKFCMAIFFVYVGVFGYFKYHVFWANKNETAFSFNHELTHIAQALKDTDQKTYIIIGTLDRLVIEIYNPENPHITYLHKEELEKISDPSSRIILPHHKEKTMRLIQERFKESTVTAKEVPIAYNLSYHEIIISK